MPRAQIRPSYRFALRPSWLVRHALALLALAVMITACSWQLARLSDKQARNRLYDERASQPVEAVDAVVAPDATGEQVEAVRFRLLAATGTYLPDEEVFVRSRSLDGQPGAWVLTPLALEGRPGQAVVINRGWIPSPDTTPELPAGAEAPAGTVTVTGLALAGETRGALGATDASGAELTVLARADVARLGEQVDEALLPVYLQLQTQQPAGDATLPRPLPPPAHDEGPHRSYAGQWAIFAAIWAVGYPMLVRRSAIRRALDERDAQGPPAHDAADDAPVVAPTHGGAERDQSMLSFRSEGR